MDTHAKQGYDMSTSTIAVVREVGAIHDDVVGIAADLRVWPP